MKQKTLKEIRLSRDLLQADVAYEARISPPYYSLIETGKRNPSISTAHKLARILGISLDELFISLYFTKDGGQR